MSSCGQTVELDHFEMEGVDYEISARLAAGGFELFVTSRARPVNGFTYHIRTDEPLDNMASVYQTMCEIAKSDIKTRRWEGLVMAMNRSPKDDWARIEGPGCALLEVHAGNLSSDFRRDYQEGAWRGAPLGQPGSREVCDTCVGKIRSGVLQAYAYDEDTKEVTSL